MRNYKTFLVMDVPWEWQYFFIKHMRERVPLSCGGVTISKGDPGENVLFPDWLNKK
jgi:hypothetical protein